MLKAIFFDAVGTLIHLPQPVGEHYRAVARLFGAELDSARLDQAFRAVWAASPARTADRLPRPDDDKGWWRDLVFQVLSQTLTQRQSTAFDFGGYFESVYAHFAEPGIWSVYPEVTAVLDELTTKGLKLAVVSNFDRRLYSVLDHLQLRSRFKQIVISSEIGADKPDPFIFEQALRSMQVAAGEAIHVGDDPKRDGGAEAVGLRVFHLERPAGTLRGLLALVEHMGVA